ncbi:cell division protein FtsQ [Pedobacter sp. BS3]|uniref:cell division protein FtsQ/DivIB n=1 Tax=Pedobacter sp. BS3 TaxID=2567937 RepID=UPI0011EFF2FF|nr:cell division protein FtsQ [Pedobacter sp. BS3]TZF81307.1 cell division protein FtsQ [Pedobacter sp. BS3]
MWKRINWRAVLYTFIWLVCLSGLVVLMSFINVKKDGVRCKDIKVLIPGSDNLIERSEVDRILTRSQGQLLGRMVNRINIHRLENDLRNNPFIEDARVYMDMDGTIQVKVRQRIPVLRVLNVTNQDFYIDKNGLKIPMSQNFTARVLAANGFILEDFTNRVDTLKTRVARDLFTTASFIEKDSLWSNQIEQLFVNEKSEIEMIPRVGNQRIVLGNADSLENKFRNLLAFYKQAMPKVGWDTYKIINIKYAHQVVGVKNTAADSLALKKAAIAHAARVDSMQQDKQDTVKILTQ